MRRTAVGVLCGIGLAAAVAAFAGEASANKLDLAIGRFVTCPTPDQCYANVKEYEEFLAEYFFALSPKLMAPADTLGYSGFYLGVEATFVPIMDKGTYRPYNLAESADWYKGTGPESGSPDGMFVPAIHVRKGLPWSFELGGSINYLAQSEVVGIGGEVKWSLFEGYIHGFRGALPNLAARGSVVRIVGTADLDVTIVGVDGSISRPFGIGGQIVLTPYAGFQYLWTLVRTEPMVYKDAAGFHPMEGTDYDTTMLSGPNLSRMKLFLGLRLKYELLAIVVEGAWGLEQSWATALEVPGDDWPDAMKIAYNEQRDASVGNQFQFNFGVGFDF